MMQSMYIALLVAVSMLVVGVHSVPAEEGTVKATSAWQGQGRFFQVKEKQALFVGAFSGIMFVETKQGTLDAAKIVCPGMVEVNLSDGTQSGEGRCIITARDGGRVYARWNCAGEHLAGCKGAFTLLGGTGRFERITGQSEFLIRSDIATYVVDPAAEGVQATASGLAVWPALTYKTP
jgi:hypothetical protein